MHHPCPSVPRIAALLLALAAAPAYPQAPQAPPDTAQLLAAQRQAMLPLAALDGTWRGTARLRLPDGSQREITQTERIGSLLGGTVKLIEGRGYGPEGQTEFNAFAVISFAPQTGSYHFNSWAQGHRGDFPFELRPDGFVWTIKFGPVTLRHTATVKDGTWTEIGERLMEGRPTVRTIEMSLQRIGPADWPQAGAVPAR